MHPQTLSNNFDNCLQNETVSSNFHNQKQFLIKRLQSIRIKIVAGSLAYRSYEYEEHNDSIKPFPFSYPDDANSELILVTKQIQGINVILEKLSMDMNHSLILYSQFVHPLNEILLILDSYLALIFNICYFLSQLIYLFEIKGCFFKFDI